MRILPYLLALFTTVTSALCAEDQVQTCKKGPWGHVEFESVYLEAPEWILDNFNMPNGRPRWSFPGANEKAVKDFLAKLSIDPAARNRWLEKGNFKLDDEALTLFPTPAEVEALPSAARGTLYRELAKSPLNQFHHEPAYIPGNSVDAWLKGAKLPEHAMEVVRKLTYLDGSALFFSDFHVLVSQAKSDAEARSWVAALTRTRAVVPYLVVQPGDDLAALSKYWSADFRRRDNLPMLKSLAERAAGGRLDITHLLPPIPRQLAFSYPTPDFERAGATPNCHWTSLNFFNYTRQDIYLDLKLAASRVMANYEKRNDPPGFGDLLLFLDAQGNATHSCVFIADEIVFTKNGENSATPWIFARLEDVKQIYLRKPEAKIQVFRKRWPTES
jgi:hypothetical protein